MNSDVAAGRLDDRCALGERLSYRHLQHGGPLPFAELRHQHVAAVRKFDRVMVTVRDMRIDLVEFADAVVDASGPDPAVVVFDLFGKREFGAGKQADRNSGIAFEAKPRVEVPRKVVVISVSPTLAGRFATAWRL